MEYPEPLEEALARAAVEHQAAQIDWQALPKKYRPLQAWLDDTDNPFEPEEPAP